MRWPWQRKQPEIKMAALGTSDSLGAFLIAGRSGAAFTPSAARHIYENSTAVSVPVNMIADGFSAMEPVLEVMTEDGTTKFVTDHEVLDQLRGPSPFYSGQLYREMQSKEYLITGETWTVAIGNPSRAPLELQPISPWNMTVPQGSGGLPANFTVSGVTLPGIYLPKRKGNEVRYFADGNQAAGAKEINQTRNYSTRDNSLLRGQSPILSASKQAWQDIEGAGHNLALLENGARASLFVHFNTAEPWQQDDHNEHRRRFMAQFGGVNKGSPIIMSGPKPEVHDMATSNVDMDFAVLQGAARQACALQYRVPLPLVVPDRATLDNMKVSVLALYHDAIIPLSKRIWGSEGRFLLPRYGLDPARVRITFNPLDVPTLAASLTEALETRRKTNVETINELRGEFLGRESVDGGDVIREPAMMVPVGTDLFTADNDPELMKDRNADGKEDEPKPGEEEVVIDE